MHYVNLILVKSESVESLKLSLEGRWWCILDEARTHFEKKVESSRKIR